MSVILRDGARQEVIVDSPQALQNIDPAKVYKLGTVIDFTGTGLNIVVPAGGFTFRGLGSNVSGLKCDDDGYTLFVSAAGGSGDVLGNDCFIDVNGAGSQVYNLVDVTQLSAFEFGGVNYNNCTSLGVIDSYRQGLEVNTGRYGGAPELELRGNWVGGYRISTSLVRGIEDVAALFKAGAGLVFNGRFVTDINADMPTNGALFDFSEANVAGDESLIIDGSFVTRNGALNSSDVTLYPNIDHTSIKSNWSNNTGLPNTKKYIKAVCSAEVLTPIIATTTYYPLLGTFTVDKAVQLSMPVNGQYELLTGNGLYNITGTIQIRGTAGDLVGLRVAKSSDGFATAGVSVSQIQLEIANLSGPNDFATFSVNFIQAMKKGDRLRLEVENLAAVRDLTMGAQSFLVVSGA